MEQVTKQQWKMMGNIFKAYTFSLFFHKVMEFRIFKRKCNLLAPFLEILSVQSVIGTWDTVPCFYAIHYVSRRFRG